MKKSVSIAFSLVLMLALSMTVLAAGTSQPQIIIQYTSNGETAVDTTEYNWYRIFDADITKDPTQNGNEQTGGEVAYYLTTSARAAAIEGTGLFNVTHVAGQDKWYVELKDEATAAETIAAAFADESFDLSVFPTGSFERSGRGANASSGVVDPGYYYITSTAGAKAVIQTLTKVQIVDKNTFPTLDKAVAEDDVFAQIGDDINYTLTVNVPLTANAQIVLTDTMSKGLTFKSIDSCTNSDDETVAYTATEPVPVEMKLTNYWTQSEGTGPSQFTITFDAETVIANQGKTISVQYTAVLNKDAISSQTGDKNESAYMMNRVKLNYGNDYESLPKEVITFTNTFGYAKVDGSDSNTYLTGAEFQFKRKDSEDVLQLVEIEAGRRYRIATQEEIEDPEITTTDTMTTNGKTVYIEGLDVDVIYQLVETKAPTGYNKLADPVEVKKAYWRFFSLEQKIANNKGATLPSTGGEGTALFFALGGVLTAAAAVTLLDKRRRTEAE